MITGNLASIRKQVEDKVDAKINAVVAEAIYYLGENVVSTSPVGEYHKWSQKYQKMAGVYGIDYIEGHYVLNWQFAKNTNDDELEDRGQDAKQRANENIYMAVVKEKKNFHKGGKWHLFNNTSYAMDLEMGWSQQAPMGIVGLAAQNWKSHVQESVRENK